MLDTGASNAITNKGGATLEAQTGATLEIESNVTNSDPTTSVIKADDGGTVELVADTVTGGTINLDGSGAATTLQIEGSVTLSASTTTTLSNDSRQRHRQHPRRSRGRRHTDQPRQLSAAPARSATPGSERHQSDADNFGDTSPPA